MVNSGEELLMLTHVPPVCDRFITLPKSDTPSRIYENKDVFDFELSRNQMMRLDALADAGDEHIAWDPTNAE